MDFDEQLGQDPFSDDDEASIVFEEMAKPIVLMFRAFQKQGLSGSEAAALTAAIFSQSMPQLGDL